MKNFYRWHDYFLEKPKQQKDYLLTMQVNKYKFLRIAKYIFDLHQFRPYEFVEESKISGFVDFDPEFGYYQIKDSEILAWKELPKLYEKK